MHIFGFKIITDLPEHTVHTPHKHTVLIPKNSKIFIQYSKIIIKLKVHWRRPDDAAAKMGLINREYNACIVTGIKSGARNKMDQKKNNMIELAMVTIPNLAYKTTEHKYWKHKRNQFYYLFKL